MAVGRPDHDGLTTSQRATHKPQGFNRYASWRSVSPFHGVVFGGMLHNITAAAERASCAAVVQQSARESTSVSSHCSTAADAAARRYGLSGGSRRRVNAAPTRAGAAAHRRP